MKNAATPFSRGQLVFDELFVGTLIYAVVLGFFDDYTQMVDAVSFSTIFLAGLVLELLTFAVMAAKKRVIFTLKVNRSLLGRITMVFSVWAILFVSKFVFVWVVDLIFGDNINIYGFFGILSVALSATVIGKVADYTFTRLGK